MWHRDYLVECMLCVYNYNYEYETHVHTFQNYVLIVKYWITQLNYYKIIQYLNNSQWILKPGITLFGTYMRNEHKYCAGGI